MNNMLDFEREENYMFKVIINEDWLLEFWAWVKTRDKPLREKRIKYEYNLPAETIVDVYGITSIRGEFSIVDE